MCHKCAQILSLFKSDITRFDVTVWCLVVVVWRDTTLFTSAFLFKYSHRFVWYLLNHVFGMMLHNVATSRYNGKHLIYQQIHQQLLFSLLPPMWDFSSFFLFSPRSSFLSNSFTNRQLHLICIYPYDSVSSRIIRYKGSVSGSLWL